jgi:thermolabile hemolysin
MKKSAPLISFLAVTFLCLQVTSGHPSELSKFRNLVVFGDSLSDNGNSFAASGVPPAPYFEGRWSNGLNWVDYFPTVAHHFPPVTPFLRDGGTNFAVGGATSAQLSTQIEAFLDSPNARDAAIDLYVIWIGANDFRAGISPIVTIQNIRNAIKQLSVAGAPEILVINIPDLSLTPDVIALGGPAIQAAKEFTFTLDILLDFEVPFAGWISGVHSDVVDINSIFTQIVYCPTRYGFTNSIGAAFNPATGALVPDPNDYVFWDGFHPTTKAHYIAAHFIYRTTQARISQPF